MDASERPEVLRDTDPITQRRGNPRVDGVSREPGSDEQAPPRNPSRPCAPDEGVFETFVGAAGI